MVGGLILMAGLLGGLGAIVIHGSLGEFYGIYRDRLSGTVLLASGIIMMVFAVGALVALVIILSNA